MQKTFQFVNAEQEFIYIPVPKNLKGKLVEIVMQEKAPDPDTHLNASETQQMASKEAELQLLDKVRNQLNVWDI